MASEDWADTALVMLAKGDREEALATAVSRLREMKSEERGWASGTLLLLSGTLGIEEAVNERMREAGMIDLMENKVLAPLSLQQFEKGRNEGMQRMLTELLNERFGALPAWAGERLRAASDEELHRWARRVLHTASLEETLD